MFNTFKKKTHFTSFHLHLPASLLRCRGNARCLEVGDETIDETRLISRMLTEYFLLCCYYWDI